MNTTLQRWSSARLALRARRSQILLGLSAALAVLAVLLGNSCTSNGDYPICRIEEERGNFLYDKDELCGCERQKCDPGTRCFHGDCCDPVLYAEDHERCGCAATCTKNEVCHGGKCCDPTSDAASTRANCGCAGPCADRENCEKDASGRYTCVCDPKLSLTDRDNCGCTGTVCDPDTERCRQGSCECDPLAGPTQQDDADCACRGECPFVMEGGQKVRTAYCYGGVCHCFSADEVICDGKCMKQSECTCEPQKHRSDAVNCACNGPCGPGDACVDGACTCDPIAHANDNVNCGCSGTSCDVAKGETCSGGACVCTSAGSCACEPAKHLSDAANCACNGPCAIGDKCAGGACGCDPLAHSQDMANCGCLGLACNSMAGEVCSQGVCICPPEHQTNSLQCGCPAVVCGQGAPCVGGVCGTCQPLDNVTIQPIPWVAGDDGEFEGHGPVVTVTVDIALNPVAHTLTVQSCVHMIETNSGWTEGEACQTQAIFNVQGSQLVSPSHFMLKYTDNNHAQDDAMQKASSIQQNPVVVGVTCMGDHAGADLYPDCQGDDCSGCTLQFGCVMIAP